MPPVRPASIPSGAAPAIAPAVPRVAAAPRPPPPPRAGVVPSISAPAAQPSASGGGGGISLDAEQLIDLEQRTDALDTLDYFEVLKLERTATPADIKKAFYRESRTYHPDRFFQLQNAELKEKVKELYKRVTEAYFVLRDDTKRRLYLADISGPERAAKLRFTEMSETETKQAAKREQAEQIGTHPKGREFFTKGMKDYDSQRWDAAERNFKMAVTYEPQNARYKEKLTEVQGKLNELTKGKGEQFKIK